MKLYRVEGSKSWVAYFVCPEGVSDIELRNAAADVLEDDDEGMSFAGIAVNSLVEVQLDDAGAVEKWLRRIENDEWLNVSPFITGHGVPDSWDEEQSCSNIIRSYVNDMMQNKRDAELDSRQTELPLLDD